MPEKIGDFSCLRDVALARTGYEEFSSGLRAAFENEDVWNLEAGIKQSFGRFAWNASLFHYRYDNRQSVRLIDPDPNNPVDIPRFVFDTGDLEATGIDFDMRWKVTDALTLDAQAEWIDSKYNQPEEKPCNTRFCSKTK